MKQNSRSYKSWMNAKVNLIFYFITLCISFFSRKIFLDYLGADFLGVTGTIGNLLGFLNLAELGIGASIGYVLYKPLYKENHRQICEIISVFGYLYRIIGLVILFGGIVLSFFLPLIFSSSNFSIGIIFLVYYAFLTGCLFGYFVNYRYTLLGADQKSYLVTIYFQMGSVLKTIVQMSFAYYTQSYIIWIVVDLLFNIAYCFILNYRIDKEYPWLKTSYKEGKKLYKQYPIIMEKSKQMFIHKISTFARYQILPFLIYPFSSLSAVAYYGNYTLITGKVTALANSVLNGTSAGIGNLIAENNLKNTMKVYWELNSVRYFFSGFTVFGLYHLIEPFISLWLGSEYILGKIILLIVLCDVYISQIRGTNDQFINGHGLFQDTWAPVTEIVLVIIGALIGGFLFGFPGVLAGSLPGDILIVSIWKPYMLFKKGFQLPVKIYWKQIGMHIGLFLFCGLITHLGVQHLPINPYHNYYNWILYSLISIATFGLLYFTLVYHLFHSMRSFTKRILHKFKFK